jgi:membrane glycosyltransferase
MRPGRHITADILRSAQMRQRLLAKGIPESLIQADANGNIRLVTTPPLRRTPMAPRGWSRTGSATVGVGTGGLRRMLLVTLVLTQTLLASGWMVSVLPKQGGTLPEQITLFLFTILFGWVSAGFWTAVMGFFLILLSRHRQSLPRASFNAGPDPRARTAIIMPICNENVGRVFAGLRATYASLAQTGKLAAFDFYVLSDSHDPDCRVAELEAWLELCTKVGGFGHIFYRWRRHRIKNKSGNVADFCRRWGCNYRYMVVLDADSVMSGSCLVRLMRLMEANPRVGILQTAPRAVGRDTLYARMQQFANHAYGPLFTAGLHFWQLGESHYWGHNAIIRIEPFMRHCALSRLPGRGALSGPILSHDFVEAALMRRAGWQVWVAYDLPGSYEEVPSNMLDELRRDRRWCQGNLMNFRLLLTAGLHPVHRAIFVSGVLAYISAPLWFASLLLATGMLAAHTVGLPHYYLEPYQVLPQWPHWHPERAALLFAATATLLYLPKILGIVLIATQGARRHGGIFMLTLSMLVEMVISMLLAPVRMLFHSYFVLTGLLGYTVSWRSPAREDAEISWGEGCRRYGLCTALGAGWSIWLYHIGSHYLWWFSPIVGALVLAAPVAVLSSRVSLGRRLRRNGLFVIPEEKRAPPVLGLLASFMSETDTPAGFHEAITEPGINALVCACSSWHREQTPQTWQAGTRLLRRALLLGPESLEHTQKAHILNNATLLAQLHRQVGAAGTAHTHWHMLATLKTRAKTAAILESPA